jgi:predicted small secreted protein
MERKMAKIAMMVLALTVVLTGCNTIAGAGQDVSAGGKAITNSAEQAK